MLQTPAGKMILLIHLAILVFASKHAAGDTTECGKMASVYQNLEVAEQMIKKAKAKLPTRDEESTSLPMDCEDLYNRGYRTSGVYSVRPKNRIITQPINVYCDMDTDGGGWTVFQRRGNFSRAAEYFNQDWKAYKEGFGDLKEDFWLGNDYIYALSNLKQYSIRIDLEDFDGVKKYATYDKFWVEEESNNYNLHVTGYYGDAGDSFATQNDMKFTTKDRDNDKHGGNCAVMFKGGWWFTYCFDYGSFLNGPYPADKKVSRWLGLQWQKWKGEYESIAKSEMKIRKNRLRNTTIV